LNEDEFLSQVGITETTLLAFDSRIPRLALSDDIIKQVESKLKAGNNKLMVDVKMTDFNTETDPVSAKVIAHRLAQKKYRASTHALFKDISEQIFSFVKGTGLIAILVFAVSAICFGISGLKAAVFFALWNAVTNIIPYVGPYIGGIPIIAVAFATDYRLGIIITVVVIAIQLIESYILHPIVMSKTMKLHPVTIILGLLIFGHFFGIIGMVIATPLTAIIKTIWLFLNDKFKITQMFSKNQKNEE